MTLSPYWLLLLTVLLPLPFSTDRRGRRVPWVTYTLIGLNVFVYVAAWIHSGIGLHDNLAEWFSRLISPGHENDELYDQWGFIPAKPHFITLLSGLFLHSSLLHLAGNMLFLWLFGPHVEEALGWEAFLALYLGGGIMAGLLHMAIILVRGEIVMAPLVGASGAISAILAPFAIRFHRTRILLYWLPGAVFLRGWTIIEVPAVAGLCLWLLQNIGGAVWFLLPSPASGGVWSLLPPAPSNDRTAYWAHIGGFVFGLVAAELTGLLRDGRQDYLLQDARMAAAQGQETLTVAVRKYRAFLDHDPDNAGVRAELSRLLAVSPEHGRMEAGLEMLAATRGFLRQADKVSAARCAGEARALGLTVLLTPRERLRLAGAAESVGDYETAILLLRLVVEETPESPEDEMARFKLGQLLQGADPEEAAAALTEFLAKYPHSEWARQVRLALQTNV